jgi:hypothetical protein
MGREMIIYEEKGIFKYALSSTKTHMSLHVMPMYGSTVIRSRYAKLLNRAKFQKGCINFNGGEEMPLETVKQLIEDCAKVDYIAIVERHRGNSSAARRRSVIVQ